MNKVISDISESEFLKFVKKICDADFDSDEEHSKVVLEFKALSGHPSGSDLIYYSEEEKSGPEAIVAEVKAWRAANGKPGFKPS